MDSAPFTKMIEVVWSAPRMPYHAFLSWYTIALICSGFIYAMTNTARKLTRLGTFTLTMNELTPQPEAGNIITLRHYYYYKLASSASYQ